MPEINITNTIPLDVALERLKNNYLLSLKMYERTKNPKYIPKSQIYIGPPGIGKTEMIIQKAKEIAKEINLPFVLHNELHNNSTVTNPELLEEILATNDKYFIVVDLNLNSMDSIDFGIPDVTNKINVKNIHSYRILIPYLFAVLINHPGILFLDELTNVQDLKMITAIYKLLGEKKIGDRLLNDKTIIIAAGNDVTHASMIRRNIMTAALINRCGVWEVTPPSPESWLKYMISQYPNVPKFFVGFLSDILHNVYKRQATTITSLAEDIESKPVSQRLITTPRSLEEVVICMDKYITGRKIDLINQSTDFILDISGYIEKEDLLSIINFIEQMQGIKQLLNSDQKLSRGLQIASLMYIGELISNYAMACRKNDENMKRRVLQTYNLIKLEDIHKYFDKLSKSKELLNFILLGAGISDKRHSIMESVYIMGFLTNIISGKSVYDTTEMVNRDLNFSIYDLIMHDSRISKEQIINTLNNYANNNSNLNSLVNIFSKYFDMHLEDFKTVLTTYMASNLSNREQCEVELRKFLDDREIDFFRRYNELNENDINAFLEKEKNVEIKPFDNIGQPQQSGKGKNKKTV